MSSLILLKAVATVLTFGIVGVVVAGLVIMLIEICRADDKTFSDWGEE